MLGSGTSQAGMSRQQGDSALAGGSGNGGNQQGGNGGNQQGGQSGLGHGRGSQQSNPKSKGKGKPGSSGNGKGKETTSTSSTASPSTQGKEQSGLQDSETVQASVRAMQGSSTTSSAPATSTAPSVAGSSSEQELMGEVASLLKSLRVGEGNPNPQLSAVRLARVLNQDKAVLIDGGATHCLRNPHSREEYLNHAEEVRVDLAAGSVRMRQDTGTGTLYSEDPNLQPIVPLADVIKVGVVVKWDSSGCEMRYRSGEKLPVFLQDGCPMLPMQRGMELLYEVEEFNRRKLKLRRAVTHPQPDRDREEEVHEQTGTYLPRGTTEDFGESSWEGEL